MTEKNKFPKDSSVIRIGPKLKLILEEQKKRIREVTYNCVEPSDYEAGEIIAKKVVL